MTVVKICDVRNAAAASACASAGADLLGLHAIDGSISPEKLSAFQAIQRQVGSRVGLVLVTRTRDRAAIERAASQIDWRYIQLHAAWSPREIGELRASTSSMGRPPGLIGVVEASPGEIARMDAIAPLCEVVLVDSSLRGGTGVRAPDELVRELIKAAKHVPLLVAGGLAPENVGSVVQRFRPWGVDVQTSVCFDGSKEKDPSKVAAFVRAVRAAQALPQ